MRGILDQVGRAARHLVVALALATLGAAHGQTLPEDSAEVLQAMPGARAQSPESRIGQVFWVRPKAPPFSVDFFDSPDMERRVPLEGTRRFAVMGLIRAGERESDPLLYVVRFGPGEEAVIPVASFEAQLYVDLPPQSETRLKSDLYLSPQAYFFSLKSIFSEDPDALWERIRNLGPTRIRPQVSPERPPSKREGRKP